jgi:hypothetical protein
MIALGILGPQYQDGIVDPLYWFCPGSVFLQDCLDRTNVGSRDEQPGAFADLCIGTRQAQGQARALHRQGKLGVTRVGPVGDLKTKLSFLPTCARIFERLGALPRSKMAQS